MGRSAVALGASLAAGLLAVIAAGAPVHAGGVAQTAQAAPAEPTRKDLEKAYEEAFQDVLEDPGNLDKSFRFAELAIKVGDLEGAISALERMLILNPRLPRVRLELGVLYFRLGSYALARSYLKSAVAGEEVPEIVRERVARFLAEIESRLARHRLFGSLTVGMRYQTNANAGPASTEVRVQGVPAELEERFTAQEDFNAFGALDARHVFDFETQDRTVLESALFVFGSKQVEEDRVDVSLTSLDTGPRLRLPPDVLGEATLRPFIRGSYVYLDDGTLFWTYGGGVDVAKRFGEWLGATLEYRVEDRLFSNTTGHPTATDKSGVQHRGTVGLQYAVTPAVNGFAQARVVETRAAEGFEAYREYAGLLGAAVSYEAPFGLTPRRWVTSVNAEYTNRSYRRPDPAVHPSTRRVDRRWDARFLTRIPVLRTLSVAVSASYTTVDATLPNFEFDNTAVALSGIFSF